MYIPDVAKTVNRKKKAVTLYLSPDIYDGVLGVLEGTSFKISGVVEQLLKTMLDTHLARALERENPPSEAELFEIFGRQQFQLLKSFEVMLRQTEIARAEAAKSLEK